MVETFATLIFLMLIVGFLQVNAKLDDMKRRINDLETKLIATMKKLGAEVPSRPMPPEVLGLLQAGRKIEAIKVYREHTGQGLKDAKDAVEQVARENGLG